MVFYSDAKTYRKGVLAASEALEIFEDDERNALRGVYYILLCQNDRVLPSQKRIGNHSGDGRIDQLNFSVYFGWVETGGVYVDVQRCPNNRINSYYLSGFRPVRILYEPNGNTMAWVYNWETGIFEKNFEYVAKIYHSHGDVEEIDEETFINEVGELRESLFGMKHEGKNARSRNNTFALFEADCRKRIPGYPESMRVMDALNRVLAIRWERLEKSQKSYELLLREACRRIALFIKRMNLNEKGPLFNIAEYMISDDQICKQVLALLQENIVNVNNYKVCLCFIHWEQVAEQISLEKLQEQNPYEPLIYLFERGGDLHDLDQVWADTSFSKLTINELEKMSMRLDFEVLNRVDSI